MEYEDKIKELRRDSFEDNQKNPFDSSGFGIKNSVLI